METIAAISTPIGIGGLGIIRISGKEAFSICRDIFISKKLGKRFSVKNLPSHTIHFGFLKYQTKKVDEVLMSVFKKPHSYTGEDTVEFTCHGGALVMENAMASILATGKARLAEQGEFTKKAFLNGKLDLIQAEAVADIIEARTSLALDRAVSQLDGKLSFLIRSFRKDLIAKLSESEARIEFPDDASDDAALNIAFLQMKKDLQKLTKKIHGLLGTFEAGYLLRQGINVAIVGAPNSGKSTLLNALLGFERAIVTSVPGTTRDFLKESLFIEGAMVNFIDTAGIRKARNAIEKKGIDHTHNTLTQSTIAVHVIDGSKRPGKDDSLVYESLKNIPEKILVVNKTDKSLHASIVPGLFGYKKYLLVSAKTGKGVGEIKKELISTLKKMNTLHPYKNEVLTNVRHKHLLESCLKELEQLTHSLTVSAPEELIAEGLKQALNHLDQLLGATTPEDILNNIFSRFCIGK